MKVVYISRSIIPSRTANSVHVMKMCGALAELGHDVTLIVPLRRKRKMEENVDDAYHFYGVKRNFKIVKLPSLKLKQEYVFYSLAVSAYLLMHKPDLVHGRHMDGIRRGAKLGFKVGLEEHEPFWERRPQKMKCFRQIIASPGFQKLVVNSEALKNIYLRKIKELTAENILVAHNGADPPDGKLKRSALQGDFSKLNIGYIGHLYKGKGGELIAHIAAALREYNFHVIGGMEKDIRHWREKINSENVFLYGFIPQSDLSGYLAAMDVCLLPIQRDVRGFGKSSPNIANYTSPMKMFDYLAHGKLIIASDLPVVREVLNENNAVLLDPDDTAAWIETIRGLNRERIDLVGRKARQDFMRNHTWQLRAAKLINALS